MPLRFVSEPRTRVRMVHFLKRGQLVGMSSRAARGPGPTSADSGCDRDEVCYELLEEARLRCDRICRVIGDAEFEWLRATHRHLGLAGFFVSSSIPSPRRRQALAAAHHRCRDNLTHLPDAFQALQASIRRACSAVERGLCVPEVADHMHLAHVHLLAAQELLHAATGQPGLPGQRRQPS